mmetsp:Transcript_14375/g.13957  ORF Transcript_14375/g.13957 Transcript_14375/m.13957 type:complete len:161 (-) Transcript_14375:730-1212(-)
MGLIRLDLGLRDPSRRLVNHFLFFALVLGRLASFWSLFRLGLGQADSCGGLVGVDLLRIRIRRRLRLLPRHVRLVEPVYWLHGRRDLGSERHVLDTHHVLPSHHVPLLVRHSLRHVLGVHVDRALVDHIGLGDGIHLLVVEFWHKSLKLLNFLFLLLDLI